MFLPKVRASTFDANRVQTGTIMQIEILYEVSHREHMV